VDGAQDPAAADELELEVNRGVGRGSVGGLVEPTDLAPGAPLRLIDALGDGLPAGDDLDELGRVAPGGCLVVALS